MAKTFFNSTDRERIIERTSRLAPDAERHWGRMTAPQMVAHLRDQMAHCLGERPSVPVKSILRWRPIRFASIYLIPWPKGRIKGPIDAFVTQPGAWDADISHLIALVRRFAETDPGADWPPHALFGPMTGRDWGVFLSQALRPSPPPVRSIEGKSSLTPFICKSWRRRIRHE